MSFLARLAAAPLPAAASAILEAASRRATGPRPWRLRKQQEAADLLRLPAVTDVAVCQAFDIDDELRALVQLDTPVAVRAESGEVTTVQGAVIEVRCLPPGRGGAGTGAALVLVLHPARVFHPNVLPGMPRALCLGHSLPPSIRAVELVWLAYRSLAMQAVTADEHDPAGVLDREAARYWQTRVGQLPLTHRNFLRPRPVTA